MAWKIIKSGSGAIKPKPEITNTVGVIGSLRTSCWQS